MKKKQTEFFLHILFSKIIKRLNKININLFLNIYL